MNDHNKRIDFIKHSFQLIGVLKRYPRLLIYIKGSPDPDAIAGSYALKLLCDMYGVKSSILSPQEASLPQNIKIIKDLHLPVAFKEIGDIKNLYDAYGILDHQSAFVEGISGIIPCAVHIDHHEPIIGDISIDFQFQIEESGSTSTLIILILNELNIPWTEPHWRNASTAMYYGIQTDTDNFQYAEKLDHHAIKIISPYVDKSILNQINSVPFSKEALNYYHLALQNQVFYKNWLISGLGYINEKYRDTIGIIGDLLLKREGIEVVVIFALVESMDHLILDASFRTQQRNLNLNTMIKQITKEGGARKFKGAFQINLDYFINCPDRTLLWKTVYLTTIETLKKRWEVSHASDIQKFFLNLKEKLQKIFQ